MSKKPKRQFEAQLEGEEILLVFRRHPIVMRKGLIISLIFILMGAIAGSIYSSKTVTTAAFFGHFFMPVGLAFVASAVVMFYFWIGWYYSVGVVTNKRFLQIQQVGLFKRRSVNDISLHRILSVNYDMRGMLETVLNFGTIIVQTLVGDLVIHKVSHPAKRQVEIISAIKESGVELDEQTEAAIN